MSIVRGPPGSYVAEWLAGAIESWDRWPGCVWLRAGGIGQAELARSLASACAHRWADDDGLQRRPGEVPPSSLAETIRLAPAGAVIVLELQGRLSAGTARLLDSIRPAAAEQQVSLVAVAESRAPAMALRGADCIVPTGDLVDPTALVEASALPSRCHDRLARLAGRRAAVLHDVLDAAEAWPTEAVVDALGAASRYRSLLDRLTATLLELCSPGQRAALEVSVATGYWHPQLATHAVQASELRPWVVPLERQWGWLRPLWARSLERQLSGRAGIRSRGRAAVSEAEPGGPRVPEPSAAKRGILEARLLGHLELRLDGLAVTAWAGQRGTSVLRYLLSRRRYACSRDELLEEFWPDVDPELARNRLQVAVSGLRRTLRSVTNLHVIEYADGSYRINPEIKVSVDVERFEEALSTARAAERAPDLKGALVAYREAIGLYRGDFASDAPYEQWTLLPRESMRITYIDALDRVSRIQLDMGKVDDCIATGHQILDVDPSREDAHRLLMRCYAYQGRTYQAVRQYDFCRRVLRATLDMDPSPQTTQLYRTIRAGSTPEPALMR